MKKIRVKDAEEFKKALEIFALTGLKIGEYGQTPEEFTKDNFSPNEPAYRIGIDNTGKITAWFNNSSDTECINFSNKEGLADLIVEILSY